MEQIKRVFVLKVWPMGTASTVSRSAVTVKVVPVLSQEEVGSGGEQQQSEQEGEEPQQRSNQSQAEEDAAQTG